MAGQGEGGGVGERKKKGEGGSRSLLDSNFLKDRKLDFMGTNDIMIDQGSVHKLASNYDASWCVKYVVYFF